MVEAKWIQSHSQCQYADMNSKLFAAPICWRPKTKEADCSSFYSKKSSYFELFSKECGVPHWLLAGTSNQQQMVQIPSIEKRCGDAMFPFLFCAQENRKPCPHETWVFTHTAAPNPRPEPQCPSTNGWANKVRRVHKMQKRKKQGWYPLSTRMIPKTSRHRHRELHAVGFNLYEMP